MGALCSRGGNTDCSPSSKIPCVDGHVNNGAQIVHQSTGADVDGNLAGDLVNKGLHKLSSFTDASTNDGISQLSTPSPHRSISRKSKQKVSEVGSFLGKVGSTGLGKAVEALDTLGSSMTSLHFSSAFVSGVNAKGNRILILAFEVANTIVKGANLMQALSEDNITHLKEVVLLSEGVQRLMSEDMDELLRIAAADKRDELNIFCGEVVRFGNRCKDPQWHNLDRYFHKLGSELAHQKNLKEETENVMHELLASVQYTAALYHELNASDRFEQDYRRKLQEASERGESLSVLRAEWNCQKKHIKRLKKKSLWSRILDEVMGKLVDIVHFLHLAFHKAFGSVDGGRPVNNNNKKLGLTGLALHYANIITQIDSLVARSSSVPSSSRDALYQGLPPSIKAALRFKLQSYHHGEGLTVAQIKVEMEKTLDWLVPMATNTTKFYQGFGWVGEWAITGNSVGNFNLVRLETLHHADKDKTETYILELVVWLHHLVCKSRSGINGGLRSPTRSPLRSSNQKTIRLSLYKPNSPLPPLTFEDQEMLRDVSKWKLTPGISKSQEFDTAKSRLRKYPRLSKSCSYSSPIGTPRNPFPVRDPSSVSIIDFQSDHIKAFGVINQADDS